MATALDPTLTNKQFHNWLKGALALLFGKEGLTDFVKNGITQIQMDLLQSVCRENGLPTSTRCSTCTTENLLSCPTKGFCDGGKKCTVHKSNLQSKKPNQPCPNGLCDKIKQAIRYNHRYNNPSWKNTNAQKWCSDEFELIKCYMPPDGYRSKSTLEETDFNGTIAVVYNNCYFQKNISSQLKIEPNICSRAREVGRLIRHSPDFLLSDVDLARCIDTIVDLLRDTEYLLKDPKAQEAVSKLIQLKNNTLVIQTGDLTKILDDDIRESLSKQHEDALQSMREHLCDFQSESISAIEAIMTTKQKALEEIHNTSNVEKQKLVRLRKWNPLALFSRFRRKTVNDRVTDLQQDLIDFYQEYESTLLVSPLIDDYAVPLLDLYVHIPMEAHSNPHVFTTGNKRVNAANITEETKKHNAMMHDDKTVDIKSYEQLFNNEDKDRCSHIYISASAGKGKSSFCQYLSLVWSQAHKPDVTVSKKFRKVDLDTCKHFDILFLIQLRDYQGTHVCNIDDIICKMLSNNLARGTQYSKEVVQNILHTKRCLVVLDGLDEWSHPDTCRKIPAIPHNNHPNNCTTLTTSRPWKLSILGLSLKQIDRYIEVIELDYLISRELENNALTVLNKNIESYSPDTDALIFEEEVAKTKLREILNTPFLRLQLLCMWCDGRPFGNTRCEIYFNIVEFTLERGLKKKDLHSIPMTIPPDCVFLECLEKNTLCRRYIELLRKLGKLAFFALFNKAKESTLVIDRATVAMYMNEVEVELCLKFGLLSQSRDLRLLSKISQTVSFQHKSMQEFFAGLYVSLEWNDETKKSTDTELIHICTSMSDILEMYDMFMFVCGMNPQAYYNFSNQFRNVVDCGSSTINFRTNVCNSGPESFSRELRLYQEMQIACAIESVKNGHDHCRAPLYDLVLSDNDFSDSSYRRRQKYKYDLTKWKSSLTQILLMNDKGNLKSVSIDCQDDVYSSENNSIDFDFLKTLGNNHWRSLETIKLFGGIEDTKTITNILVESSSTLKHAHFNGMFLDSCIIFNLQSLCNLQAICLENVLIPHKDTSTLFRYIRDIEHLQQLKLKAITCEDHSCTCPEYSVNLSKLTNLQKLHIVNMYLQHTGMDQLMACVDKMVLLPELYLYDIKCVTHSSYCDEVIKLNHLQHCHSERSTS